MYDAFTEPFPLSKMIRLTFITGAGKLERQKYDENAARIVMSVLREQGYMEDRGASAVMECAGTFKSQHDTGKNLKTVVVFPKICSTVQQQQQQQQPSINSEMSVDNVKKGGGVGDDARTSILHSSFTTFQRLVEYKCPSWSQKKICLNLITELEDKIRDLDDKLIHGKTLNSDEQGLYDSFSMDMLEQKEKHVKAELAKHVDEGNITRSEKEKLIGQTQERKELLMKEFENKKTDSLRSQIDKVTSRLQHLQTLVPKPLLPLKHVAEIDILCKELKPLLKLEAETKGRLLTLKEATTLARKSEILDEMKQLEVRLCVFSL